MTDTMKMYGQTKIKDAEQWHGLGGQAPKFSLTPTVKHTAQGGELCEIS